LYSNTTAVNNTAIGNQALYANTSGSGNTAVGTEALTANTFGAGNVAIGQEALKSNTTGGSNVGIGLFALKNNLDSNFQVAIGNSAMEMFVGPAGTAPNVAIGQEALKALTTGSGNVGLGYFALNDLTTGNSNVAIGANAGENLTTSSGNVAIGQQSLNAAVTGQQNSVVGQEALKVATGDANTGLGYQSGIAVTTGAQNTIIGTNAAASGTNNLTTGSNNILIGYNAAATSATVSNQVTLGNASVTNFRVPGVGLDVDTARASVTGYAKVSEYYASTAPVQKNADFTLADTENWIVNTKTSNLTVTLPSGSEYTGRAVTFINHVNHKVVSASSNVYDHATGVLGTDITSAVAGKNATIVYDGTNWYIMSTNL
jgi:hypothetical protein